LQELGYTVHEIERFERLGVVATSPSTGARS